MTAARIIDGDGHIFEDADAISKFLPDPYRANAPYPMFKLFPPLDHLHSHLGTTPPGSFRRVGPEGWIEFMEDIGIEAAVLYPTSGLACGKITNLDQAIVVTRAYNNWLHDTYVARSPRFRGMALLPMQEPTAAAEELHRAVTELGMCGAMLPSMGLNAALGAKEYWPVYAEAERLGCAIAIHGGAHEGLGMDNMPVYPPVHALGHPFGIMIGMGSIIFGGIYDRFPKLRIGFLEAGVAWLLLCLERFDRSHETHRQYDPRGELLGPQPDERVSDYIKARIREGRLFVGCEGGEPDLIHAVKSVGGGAFVYSSDFPHEVNNEYVKEEIDEIMECEELTAGDKAGIFAENADRFYGLGAAKAGANTGASAARA
jgi:predicted TIM-barrel fold metal-dependent hydrolase